MSMNQLGDTMIEVFFAMAVLSAVLGGAYVAASRALQLGRLAQERGEATKLVETQIERLKYLASKDRSQFDMLRSKASAEPMCIKSDATLGIVVDTSAACPIQDLYKVSVYTEADRGISGCYDLVTIISYTKPHPDQFLICATWIGPGNFGNQEVGIHYRVH